MAREDSLKKRQRDQIRKYVNYHVGEGWDDKQMLNWIREGFSSWPPHKAYALAYYASLRDGTPLELDRVRDSRS